jgi:hypothetical protein
MDNDRPQPGRQSLRALDFMVDPTGRFTAETSAVSFVEATGFC